VGTAFGLAMLAVPAAAPAAPFGSRTMREGMGGHDVRVLQRDLTNVGIATDTDGQFGPLTLKHVRRWQRRSHRSIDGAFDRPDSRVITRQIRNGVMVGHTPPQATSNSRAQPAPSGEQATIDSSGHAVAPADAPQQVEDVIAAANHIVGKPYRYGGGHGQWQDSGYDCSGSESYALHGGGFVSHPMTSSDFESWGRAGRGTWITSFANSGHSYLVVAGLRFDTGWHSGPSGPAWSSEMRPSDGYVVRHPAGF
jgi:hypothetical protein